MNNKAFSLIELLAVIVIVAIVAVVTVPIINNVVLSSKRDTFVDSAYALISAANDYRATAVINKTDRTLSITYPEKKRTLKVSGSLPDGGNLRMNNKGDIALKIWSNSAGICVTKGFDDTEVEISKTVTSKKNCHL